jgi:hypothetical protein
VTEPQPAGPVIAVIEIERLTGPHQQPTPRARLPVGVPQRGPTQGLMVTPAAAHRVDASHAALLMTTQP